MSLMQQKQKQTRAAEDQNPGMDLYNQRLNTKQQFATVFLPTIFYTLLVKINLAAHGENQVNKKQTLLNPMYN